MPLPAVFPVTPAKEKLPSRPFGLTRNQYDMMLVLQELYALQGRSPRYREIGAEMEMPVGNVHRILSALRSRGYIDWMKGHARSITIRVPLSMPAELAHERPRLKVLRLPKHSEFPA